MSGDCVGAHTERRSPRHAELRFTRLLSSNSNKGINVPSMLAEVWPLRPSWKIWNRFFSPRVTPDARRRRLILRTRQKSRRRLTAGCLWCEPSGAHCHAAGLRNMPAGWRRSGVSVPCRPRMWDYDAQCQRSCGRPSCDWRHQQLTVTPAAHGVS